MVCHLGTESTDAQLANLHSVSKGQQLVMLRDHADITICTDRRSLQEEPRSTHTLTWTSLWRNQTYVPAGLGVSYSAPDVSVWQEPKCVTVGASLRFGSTISRYNDNDTFRRGIPLTVRNLAPRT